MNGTRRCVCSRNGAPIRGSGSKSTCGFVLGTVLAIAVISTAHAQVGLEALIDRIGEENTPTGANVVVAQVEAHNANDNYRPNPNNAEFAGKSFTLLSGPSGNSNHATIVGRNFYGLTTSVSPDIDQIYCYSATGWLTDDLLRVGAGQFTLPLAGPPGVKIYNNSWIANLGGNSNDAARRADAVVRRDDVLMVSGVNNEDPQLPLMIGQFNGISVGRSQGGHATGDTPSGIDVPGRMKPELVAPGSATSFATGLASSAAALMVETARTFPLDQNPLAERSEVIKAALLGGAVRSSAWTNNPEQTGPARGLTVRPLDEEFGAGEVNVNNSHLILTGKQQAGHPAPPTVAHLCRAGWDLATIAPEASRFWRFRLPQPAQRVSVLLTWHRTMNPNNMSSWAYANFDLQLWRVDGTGALQPLIGPEGESFFSGGNVASESDVDNVELLHVHDLAAGEYVIEVRRIDPSGPTDVALTWLMDTAVRGGDLDGNGVVGVPDLLQLLSAWGTCDDGLPGCQGDLTCSGTVGVPDLLQLLADWG